MGLTSEKSDGMCQYCTQLLRTRNEWENSLANVVGEHDLRAILSVIVVCACKRLNLKRKLHKENRHSAREGTCHVTKHPPYPIIQSQHFVLQPCLKVMSTLVGFERFIVWIKLRIYRFEAECLLLDVIGWRRNDFCSWRTVLRWNSESLSLQARWAKDRGEKISNVTSEILGTNCILKGFWWVNWCSVELSCCQATKTLIIAFYLLGRDSISGERLWLSGPQTQQKRRKLPTKMWV